MVGFYYCDEINKKKLIRQNFLSVGFLFVYVLIN